jgi:STAS domain
VVIVLGRVAPPHVAFLGRLPGTDRFSDAARHPENEAVPGILAFRVEASLVNFNVDHVLETGLRRVKTEAGLHRMVYDLSKTPYVDVAGARMLKRLHGDLAGAASTGAALSRPWRHSRFVPRPTGIDGLRINSPRQASDGPSSLGARSAKEMREFIRYSDGDFTIDVGEFLDGRVSSRRCGYHALPKYLR